MGEAQRSSPSRNILLSVGRAAAGVVSSIVGKGCGGGETTGRRSAGPGFINADLTCTAQNIGEDVSSGVENLLTSQMHASVHERPMPMPASWDGVFAAGAGDGDAQTSILLA